MPMLHIKTFLVMIHLFGLTLGVGGATVIDLVFLRLIVRGIAVKRTHANFVILISKLVTFALIMLWVSGIGFEIQYWFVSPELIPNPKVYAKLTIVTILTINGFVLHARVLPMFYESIGRPLFDDLRSKKQIFMIVTGTVSMFSWYTPFFLGVAREMNFVVPAWWILSAYASLVLGTIGMALLLGPVVLRFLARHQQNQTQNQNAEIPSREIPSLEIPAGEMPSPEAPSRQAPSWQNPTHEVPSWEIPSWEIPAVAFNSKAIARFQHSPSSREMANLNEDDTPLILVRSWPAPASRSVSTFRSSPARSVGNAA
jgi:hypothetical protein